MLEARQMNEDGLDIREANHRMMNMLAILLALFHRNFSKFSDQGVRGAVRVASSAGQRREASAVVLRQ
jgi:two-component sensor histidine kinase